MGLLPPLEPEKKESELAKRLRALLVEMKKQPAELPVQAPSQGEPPPQTGQLVEAVVLSEAECYKKVWEDPGAWSGSSLVGAGDRNTILPR